MRDSLTRLAPILILTVTICQPATDAPLGAQTRPLSLHVDFSQGARLWQAVRLADTANRFSILEDGGRTILKAESDQSASALWRGLQISPDEWRRIRWSWKVASSLSGNVHERSKRGDDYAARFFVIFDAEPFTRQARALCYVWASSEPVGSRFANPYFANVETIVLQSGDARAGSWVTEERDFVRDYHAAFGEPPKLVTAVAVMVDTDDTKSAAQAWFDTVTIEPSPNQP